MAAWSRTCSTRPAIGYRNKEWYKVDDLVLAANSHRKRDANSHCKATSKARNAFLQLQRQRSHPRNPRDPKQKISPKQKIAVPQMWCTGFSDTYGSDPFQTQPVLLSRVLYTSCCRLYPVIIYCAFKVNLNHTVRSKNIMKSLYIFVYHCGNWWPWKFTQYSILMSICTSKFPPKKGDQWSGTLYIK